MAKKTTAVRLTDLEYAIIQINHFTEHLEGLKLEEWKGKVNENLSSTKSLVKILIGSVLSTPILTAVIIKIVGL